MAGCEEEEETRKKRQHGHKEISVSKKRERERERERERQRIRENHRYKLELIVEVLFSCMYQKNFILVQHTTHMFIISISTPLCCQWTVPNDRSNISWEHGPNFIVSSGFKFHF